MSCIEWARLLIERIKLAIKIYFENQMTPCRAWELSLRFYNLMDQYIRWGA